MNGFQLDTFKGSSACKRGGVRVATGTDASHQIEQFTFRKQCKRINDKGSIIILKKGMENTSKRFVYLFIWKDLLDWFYNPLLFLSFLRNHHHSIFIDIIDLMFSNFFDFWIISKVFVFFQQIRNNSILLNNFF